MWSRWEFKVKSRVILLVDLDSLDFFKLLDTALHLHTLRSLVTESFDEILSVGNLLLLILVSAKLLLASLLAKLNIMRVVYLIIVDMTKRDLDSSVCDIINKRAVVRHKHHSATR